MTMDTQTEPPSSDALGDLRRGEVRSGNPAKGLLLAVGIAALWYTSGGHPSTWSLALWLTYLVLSAGFTVVFSRPQLAMSLVAPLVIVSYASDLAFVTVLIAATGGLTSDLFVLFAPLALKAAVYYPILPALLFASYLIAPLYGVALRFSAGGWWFLLDPGFLPRYVMIFSLMFTAMYMAWLFDRRQSHIEQLTERLNSKARVLEETATGLGDRFDRAAHTAGGHQGHQLRAGA